MNCKDFIKNLKIEFNKFGVNDVFVKDDSLILNIEKEDRMKKIKDLCSQIQKKEL